MVTVFLVNRHLTEAMDLDMPVTGFGKLALAEHIVIGGDGTDLRAANTPDDPERIAPREGEGLAVDEGRVRGSLPPLSYHVVRLQGGLRRCRGSQARTGSRRRSATSG